MPKMMGRYHYRREATLEQRMDKVWEMQEIKQLIARRSLYIFNNDRAVELEQLWVREPENKKTAQLGSNWGYYVGLDSIKRFYGAAYPPGQDGYCAHVPNGTNIVHIAADGLTAFCLIYALSSQACDTGGGVRGCDVFDRIWFDMKKEADGWKIWRTFIGNDATLENGVNVMGRRAMALEDPERPPNPSELLFGEPDYPMTAYDPKFGWYDFPRIPDAHDAFSLDMSCSLEACLKFKAGRALRKDVTAIYEALGGDGK